MLTAQIDKRLKEFKAEGGFTENMTKERVDTLKQQSVEAGAPACPQCGKPMIRRVAKTGINSGKEFWSCSGYPSCFGTLPIAKQH